MIKLNGFKYYFGLVQSQMPFGGGGGGGGSLQPAEKRWVSGGQEAQRWEVMMFSCVFLVTVLMTELGAAFCYAGWRGSVIKADTPLL